MDLATVCRLCLAEKPELFDIFGETGLSDYDFSSIIKDIAGIDLDPHDQLSKCICSTCKFSCNDFVRFRELIISSNDYQQLALTEQSQMKEEPSDTIVIEQITDEEYEFVEEDERTYEEEPYVIDDELIEMSLTAEQDENVTSADLVTTSSSEDESDMVSETRCKFYCDYCSKIFSRRSKLMEHMKVHSQKTKFYSCRTCNRKFPKEVLLTRHEIIHSDLLTQIKVETSNRCLVCNETFKEKLLLESHMQDHKNQLDETSIDCIYCEKPYSKLSNLIRHLKTHEENKTHSCNVCQKTFAMGQDLIDHLNRHKGFNPHTCSICDKSYMQLSKLRSHMKTHSGDKVSRSMYNAEHLVTLEL